MFGREMDRKLYITGDIHGNPHLRFSFKALREERTLTKNDIVFVAGDFGLLFEPFESNREKYNIEWLKDKPWTIISILGNHENYDRIYNLPVVEKFGAKLFKVADNIFYIQNGQILTIDGKKIWCMGGAMSTDRNYREMIELTEKTKCWWKQEIPTKEEMQRGIDLLTQNNNVVDYIITHTMPSECVEIFSEEKGYHQTRIEDPVSRYLSFILNHIEPTFKNWFCGHFHCNQKFGSVQCLYEAVMEVK